MHINSMITPFSGQTEENEPQQPEQWTLKNDCNNCVSKHVLPDLCTLLSGHTAGARRTTKRVLCLQAARVLQCSPRTGVFAHWQCLLQPLG